MKKKVADAEGPTPTEARASRRLRRGERRVQILDAATRAFARSGFAATSLDEVATEAGISRVLLYRHFESKADLYRAVLDHVCTRLSESTGYPEFTSASLTALLDAAASDPAGFRLLFRHAAREPEFRDEMEQFGADMTEIAHRHLLEFIPEEPWARWAAQLVPTVAVEAVMTWLDVGQPDPQQAHERIRQALDGIIQAAARQP